MNPHVDRVGEGGLLPMDAWRPLALQFHAVRTACAAGTVPVNFEPADLARLPRRALTPAVQGVIAFLLHVWNAGNRFDLGQIQRWDQEHRQAFISWVTGGALGKPCRYF